MISLPISVPVLQERISEILQRDPFLSSTYNAAADVARLNQDVDCAVDECQAVIQAHERAIYALRSQRNAWSAVGRLPGEVVMEIFQFVLKNTKMSGIVQVSQVCQRWRDIAIDCPRLWSTLVITNTVQKDLIRLFLSRSRISPLTLKLQSHRLGYIPDLLERDISRIRHLDVLLTHPNHHVELTGVIALLQFPSPVLHSVYINQITAYSTPWPSGLHIECPPSLKRLSIVNCTESWPLSLAGPSVSEFIFRSSSMHVRCSRQ